MKEVQATGAPSNSADGSKSRVREPEKSSSSPLKNSRATKKIRYSFATPHGTMVSRGPPNFFVTAGLTLFTQYGVGTDPESARKDMESNQERIAAESGARALQRLSTDANYNTMPPAIAEAFERQRQRQEGTFRPISFLPPAQVPGYISPHGGVNTHDGRGSAQSPISVDSRSSYSGVNMNAPYPPSSPPPFYQPNNSSTAPSYQSGGSSFSEGPRPFGNSSGPAFGLSSDQFLSSQIASGSGLPVRHSAHHFGGPPRLPVIAPYSQSTERSVSSQSQHRPAFGSQPFVEAPSAYKITTRPSAIAEADDGDAGEEDDAKDTSEGCAADRKLTTRQEVATDSGKRLPRDVDILRSQPQAVSLNTTTPSSPSSSPAKRTQDEAISNDHDSLAKKHRTRKNSLSVSDWPVCSCSLILTKATAGIYRRHLLHSRAVRRNQGRPSQVRDKEGMIWICRLVHERRYHTADMDRQFVACAGDGRMVMLIWINIFVLSMVTWMETVASLLRRLILWNGGLLYSHTDSFASLPT